MRKRINNRLLIFLSLQIPLAIVQPGPTPKLKTKRLSEWTSGDIQFFEESDGELDFEEIPIVIAYNGIHHFTPTAITSSSYIESRRLKSANKLLVTMSDIFCSLEYLDSNAVFREQYQKLKNDIETTVQMVNLASAGGDLSTIITTTENTTEKLTQGTQWYATDAIPDTSSSTEVFNNPQSSPAHQASSPPVAPSGSVKGIQVSSPALPSTTPPDSPTPPGINPASSVTPGPHSSGSTGPPTKKQKISDKLICHICQQKVARSNEMGNHLRKCHNYDKLKCNMCNSEFISTAGLKVHLTNMHDLGTSKLHRCDFEDCSYRTNKESSLLVHKVKHGQELIKPQCTGCNKYFMTEDNIKKHHRDGRCQQNTTSPKKRKTKTIQCINKECRKKFTTKLGMQNHNNTYHTLEGARWVCLHCDNKTFASKQTFDAHLKNIDHPVEGEASDTTAASGSSSSSSDEEDAGQ